MERPLQPSQLRAPTAYRNLLINGDFQIDQRNAGAAKTFNTALTYYAMDRWYGYGQATDGVFTVQQVTTSVPASGAKYACKVVTTTADASIGAAQAYLLGQLIEGYNVAPLMWGNAGAKTVALSFWVRSSLIGTFGGAFRNVDNTRSYPFTFTVVAADTWEKKTVVVTGCLDGTWNSTNGIGLQVIFDLGVGSTYRGTAGAWAAANYTGATGAVSLISTLNATFYLADVQLEAGSGASDFERLPTGVVLQQCQRYYWKTYNQSVVPGTQPNEFNGMFQICANASGWITWTARHPVVMRATPVPVLYSARNGAINTMNDGNTTALSATYVYGSDGSVILYNAVAAAANLTVYGHAIFDAEL